MEAAEDEEMPTWVKGAMGYVPCLAVIYEPTPQAGSTGARTRGSRPARLSGSELPRGPKVLPCSGCLIEARGSLFWATAGHVLNDIEQYRNAGWIRGATWQDAHTGSIPAEINAWDRIAVDVDGIDFGLVHLHSNHADNLRANPLFRAFKYPDDFASFQASSATSEGDGVYVLGYPTEWTKISVTRKAGVDHAQVKLRAVRLPLRALVTRGEVERDGTITENGFWHRHCSYARIPPATETETENLTLEDIAGVSGGPVLLHRRGVWRLLGT